MARASSSIFSLSSVTYFTISSADSAVLLDKSRTWSATTAKPFPASPALAASIDALSARIFCFLWIPSSCLVFSLISLTYSSQLLTPLVSFVINCPLYLELYSELIKLLSTAPSRLAAALISASVLTVTFPNASIYSSSLIPSSLATPLNFSSFGCSGKT